MQPTLVWDGSEKKKKTKKSGDEGEAWKMECIS